MKDSLSERKEKRGALASLGHVLRLAVQDIVLAGLFLCIFALFHHVLPRLGLTLNNAATEPVAIAELAPSTQPTAEQPDGRTAWQIKFAEHFTDKVVVTDNSYTSPDVSITLTTCQQELEGYPQTWYVADIYVAQVENLQTYVENDSYTHFIETPAEELAGLAQALIGINGDFCNAQVQPGFYVRNGVLYQSDQTLCDICVLYRDGVMETYAADAYKVEDVVARNPYQVWKFGPQLLDGEGKPLTSFNTGEAILIGNPRSGIGYYEPGHYCFVTVDGRQGDWSRGLTIAQYAQLFSDLGCTAAYNLDGGASVTLTFMGGLYNRQSSPRDLGDIVLIRELADAADGGQ